MRLVVISAAGLMLVSCAQQPTCAPPSSGPIATIRFVNLSPDIPTTILFYEDGYACKGIRRLSFYGTGVTDPSVSVEASEPFTFTVDYATTRRYCRQTYMFTPGEGEYRIKTGTGTEECALLIERRAFSESGQDSWVMVDNAIEREYKAPFLESGAWCKPLPAVKPD